MPAGEKSETQVHLQSPIISNNKLYDSILFILQVVTLTPSGFLGERRLSRNGILVHDTAPGPRTRVTEFSELFFASVTLRGCTAKRTPHLSKRVFYIA